MSKTYSISFDEKQIDEINTALRIMYLRRDNQNKYAIKKSTTDKPKTTKKRKQKLFLSIVNDTLQYTETDFIPTKDTAFNKDKNLTIPLNTYLITN
jgi:hypothetical protein